MTYTTNNYFQQLKVKELAFHCVDLKIRGLRSSAHIPAPHKVEVWWGVRDLLSTPARDAIIERTS